MPERNGTRRLRRDGVVVAGPDAAEWLQGQVTQDLEGIGVGESRFSLVLSPQGKLESFCRVTRTGEDSFLLDTEAGFGSALAERLRRFKLRVKAELREVAVAADLAEGGGFGSLGPPEILEQAGEVTGDEDDSFELDRIRAGFPRLGRELTEKTIPQEAGEGFVSRTVSFTKGCYTGQELVARLDSRGSKVPRRLRLVEGAGPGEPPPAGSLLLVEGNQAGEVTSSARAGDSFVALAYVKRSFLGSEPFDVAVGEAGLPASVKVPPELD